MCGPQIRSKVITLYGLMGNTTHDFNVSFSEFQPDEVLVKEVNYLEGAGAAGGLVVAYCPEMITPTWPMFSFLRGNVAFATYTSTPKTKFEVVKNKPINGVFTFKFYDRGGVAVAVDGELSIALEFIKYE